MRRFAALRVLLLCAVLVANNLHLPLLQVTAWVGMLFSYSQDNSVATAIEMTFDGEHPCPMCKKIQKAEGGAAHRAQLSGTLAGPANEFTCPLALSARLPVPASSRPAYGASDLRCPAARADVPPTPPPIAA